MNAPVIDIDLEAVRANVAAIRAAVGVPLLAVVKAGAYGHGAVPVARAALEAGAERLGVVDIHEALELRAAGIDAPILAWMHSPRTDWFVAFDADVDLAVSSAAQLDMLARAAARTHVSRGRVPVRVHVKVDSGLGRNGVPEVDWQAVFGLLAERVRIGHLVFEGVLSHLSGTSEADDRAQLAAFERAIAVARREGIEPGLRHIAASAGALAIPEARFDLVRLGVAMYGLSPFSPGIRPDAVPLRPALTLRAPLVPSPSRPDGACVLIGTVDGLAPVVVPETLVLRDDAGAAWRVVESAPLRTEVEPIGVDGLTGVAADPPADVYGRELTLIGRAEDGHATADDWAAAGETINYEIVARLSARLERRYSGAHAERGRMRAGGDDGDGARLETGPGAQPGGGIGFDDDAANATGSTSTPSTGAAADRSPAPAGEPGVDAPASSSAAGRAAGRAAPGARTAAPAPVPAPRASAGSRGPAARAGRTTPFRWPRPELDGGPVIAPRREAVVDLGLMRRRLDMTALRSRAIGADPRGLASAVDVSADAYGHGLDRVLPLARAAGLRVLVRSEAEAERLARFGVRDIVVDADAPDSTRAAYGFDDVDGLGSAMTLRGELVHVKRVGTGHGVSYGYDWRAPEPTTLGLVPFGYADGITRRVGGRAQITIGGERHSIVGRVAMDQVVVELDGAEAWPGMPVTVFGTGPDHVALAEWAEWAEVEPQTITASLGQRVVRRYVVEGARVR